MNRIPMLDNILGQVDSLAGVIRHQTGAGQDVLRECATHLRECPGRIFIAGMGASFFAAWPAVQALETGGYDVHSVEASELLHFGRGRWRRGDVALLISRSGGSVETIELAGKMREDGVQVIAITNVAGSGLEARSHITISVGSESDRLIAVQTYTGTLLALLLLAEEVASPARLDLASRCSAVLPILRTHIDTSLAESDRWEEFFRQDGPLYLLGRGGARAALSEGALLFQETTKAAVIAMSSGQFRHGPVEVVTPDFRAIVVGTPRETRSLDWQLALDLRSMKAGVRWIGPAPDGSAEALEQLVPWPGEVPTELMPIFDIVPLQVAAYRAALWRGIRPGDFRYASEVTDKESGFPLFESNAV